MKTKLRLARLFKSKKKLHATAVRRPLGVAAATNYDEIAEPNMKLSRALLIVLLLHVVAVAGIIAFNAIKTRQPSIRSVAIATSPASQSALSMTKPMPASSPSTSATKQISETKTARLTTKSMAKDAKLPPSSGKTYVVAKGDNPVTIAKKFKVSYDDLLALNHIDDPRKLKIGQKLLIPTKTGKPKKTDQ
ncbi:MAG TPA: LysM peptidoglycan-binding domain-containing protein [Chthoniobacterales bacterium]|nr:LysM peptidoglycan-binding domain-containing protein [Chthoniobacterales bacterium]